MRLRIAHTPDSDDAFMFYAMVEGKVSVPGIEPEFIVEDIERLNRRCLSEEYDVTAISFHAYAYLSEKYDLLTSGSSMGDGYGPIILARERLSVDELKNKVIAIPGRLTSANLAARILLGDFKYRVIRFDRILDKLLTGGIDAGIIIHEGQITYRKYGLFPVIDLGQWWKTHTGLPIPLGGNAVRRSLPQEIKRKVSRLMRRSIEYAFLHRDKALDHAMMFARGMQKTQCNRFVSMYVNEYTRSLGRTGKRAIVEFLRMGYDHGALPRLVRPVFIQPEG